jgi:hypothetical protein
MKPCAKNRKLISWLAMDALDASSTRDLRAHLEKCAGCRQYLAEMRQVTDQLAAAEPISNLQASPSFHQTWLARMENGHRTHLPLGEALAALRQIRWRAAILAGAVLPMLWLVVVLAIRSQHLPASTVPASARPLIIIPAVAAADANADLSPALANYQRVASQSLDKLDDLLFHQGNQSSRSSPVCTASATSLNF